MDFGMKDKHKSSSKVFSRSDTPIFLKNNTVAIYTLLAILMRFKSTMGLEAMLEYIEHYQKLIERHNPDFKDAVKEALALMPLEKMYKDIVHNEKP